MDQILAIPADRRRINQPLLCALMAVTVLLMIGWQGLDPRSGMPGLQPAPVSGAAPIALPASLTVASR